MIPIDEPAEEAEPEAEEGGEEDIPAPDAAGATAKSKEDIPTYYAWKPFAGEPETEYDAKFVGAQSPERVKHVQKSTEPSLDGIISGSAPVAETEYDSKFVGTQSPEPVVHVEKSAEPTLDGIINQTDALVSETEYDAMTKATSDTTDAIEHVKKSTAPSLEGIMDIGAPLGGTEYDAAFKTSLIEQVTKAQKETKASLEGIFKYPGAQPAFISEYDASFAPKEDAASTVDTTAAMQDEGASAESVDPTSAVSEASPEPLSAPEPAAEPEPKSEPVMVMDGGDSAAEAINPSDPCCDCDCPCDEEAAPAAAPTTETEADAGANCDCDCCPPEEPAATVDEPASVSEPEPVPKSNFNAFESVSHMEYQWPITAGKKPADGKPTTSDLVSGVMQAAPEGATLESDLEGQLAQAKKKMASEYDSKFAWPVNSLNKRTYATGMPDSLWVLGTKGSTNVAVEKKAAKIPKASTKNAEVDHLSGAACVPDALDALDKAFVGGAAGKDTVKLEKPRIEPSKNMPMAGYVPGGAKEVLVSKDQPVEGQIPALRTSLAPNPVSVINALPMPRPVTTGGHQVGRIMGAPMTLDPLRANPRYPQLSEKQANRWETTAKAAYGAPKRLFRR